MIENNAAVVMNLMPLLYKFKAALQRSEQGLKVLKLISLYNYLSTIHTPRFNS